jgi:hypothetical protein
VIPEAGAAWRCIWIVTGLRNISADSAGHIKPGGLH